MLLTSFCICFNPRVLAGGRDRDWRFAVERMAGFNPRVLAGGRDAVRPGGTSRFQGFNPRVLAGGRDAIYFAFSGQYSFQSTRPRGRTRQKYSAVDYLKPSFNPRVLAGGRDLFMVDSLCCRRVSIHASSREDATCWRYLHFPQSCCFNPRVLAGGRDYQPTTKPAVTPVSIHASSREDATRRIICLRRPMLFQSTRPRGRTRPGLDGVYSYCQVSIHASSREDATTGCIAENEIRGFNPRVLAGGRDEVKLTDALRLWFQSTRPRGRTRRAPFAGEIVDGVSIHASSREDATASHVGQSVFHSFNPRVLAGGRDS